MQDIHSYFITPHLDPGPAQYDWFTAQPTTFTSESLQPYDAVDSSLAGNRSKKRKIERACDFCRRRKTKCDGPKMVDNVCTTCARAHRNCTYVEDSRPRGPPKSYVTSLEDRLEKLEVLLTRLRPDADFSAELGPPVIRDSWKTISPFDPPEMRRSSSVQPPVALARRKSATQLTTADPTLKSTSLRSVALGHPGILATKMTRRHSVAGFGKYSQDSSSKSTKSSHSSVYTASDDEDYGELSLVRGMQNMALHGPELQEGFSYRENDRDPQMRYHGKSSSFKLIHTAHEFRKWHLNQIAASGDGDQSQTEPHVSFPIHRRRKFWTSLPWEIDYEGIQLTTLPPGMLEVFPPPDLAQILIDDYFDNMNMLFPLLHRPTFYRQWHSGLHKTDVNDPRVLPRKIPDIPHAQSYGIWAFSGWDYVEAAIDVHRRQRSVLLPARLLEIQTFVLIGMFLRNTPCFPVAWTFMSVGIRKAQDVGAHRRKVYARKPTVEDELWKRAVWHLVAYDRIGSMILGRPCCVREDDFDIQLPLEVDDEYWENEDPELAFRQPPGKPSNITAFVKWLKLTQIAAYTVRTLYIINKSRVPLGLVGPHWQQDALHCLNTTLSEWIAGVPKHLRWTPTTGNTLHGLQAAFIFVTYHLVQINMYRPFISVSSGSLPPNVDPGLPQDLSGQSTFRSSALAICTNSARAMANIIKVQGQHGSLLSVQTVHFMLVCAGILLEEMWHVKRRLKIEGDSDPPVEGGLTQQLEEATDDLQLVMCLLQTAAPRSALAAMMLEDIENCMPGPEAPPPAQPSTSNAARRHSVSTDYRTTSDVKIESTVVPDVLHSQQTMMPLYSTSEQSMHPQTDVQSLSSSHLHGAQSQYTASTSYDTTSVSWLEPGPSFQPTYISNPPATLPPRTEWPSRPLYHPAQSPALRHHASAPQFTQPPREYVAMPRYGVDLPISANARNSMNAYAGGAWPMSVKREPIVDEQFAQGLFAGTPQITGGNAWGDWRVRRGPQADYSQYVAPWQGHPHMSR